MAGLAWTRQVLQDDARSGDLDHLGEPWALPLPPTPLEGGSSRARSSTRRGASTSTTSAGRGPGAAVARERLARLFALAGLDNPAYEAVVAAASPTGECPLDACRRSRVPARGSARRATRASRPS